MGLIEDFIRSFVEKEKRAIYTCQYCGDKYEWCGIDMCFDCFEKLVDGTLVILHNRVEVSPPEINSLVKSEEKEDIVAVVERWSKQLPKYMMLRVGKMTTTPTPTPTTVLMLVYDRKDNHNGFRWTSSYTFSVSSVKYTDTDATISAAIATLREKLHEKYEADVLSM